MLNVPRYIYSQLLIMNRPRNLLYISTIVFFTSQVSVGYNFSLSFSSCGSIFEFLVVKLIYIPWLIIKLQTQLNVMA